jgi:hypothetical protein
MRATPWTISGNDDFTQAMGEGITQATTATLATSLVTTVAEGKKVSQRTASYITEGDKLICRVWMAISQDTLCGADKRDLHISDWCASTSMSIESSRQTPSLVIKIISPFQTNGAPSMLSVASFKVCTR